MSRSTVRESEASSPDTRLLADVARHVIVPAGIASTGWPAVAAVLLQLGIVFDLWQVGLAKLVLAKGKDGLFAADTVCVSIPRQVAKTFIFGSLIFALCLIRPGSTWLWTAHRAKTSNETFRSMKSMCQNPRLAVHIESILGGGGDGEKSIEFKNGSRILFGAREKGFGRGFTKVDGIVFDEAQILSSDAVDDMVPATNQSENPLIVYAGTPPRPKDPGSHFSGMRADAISGSSDDVLYIEMSADEPPGVPGSPEYRAHLLDRKQWRKANASFPRRTTERAILRMWKNLTLDSFRREALGIWDKMHGARIMPSWDKLSDVTLRADGRPESLVIGLAGSVDGAWGSVGAAHVTEDGLLVLGAVERREGQSWLVDEAARIQRIYGFEVVLDGGGPIADLLEELDEAGVRYTALTTQDYIDSCSAVWRAADEGTLRHPRHPDLDDAVQAATWRKVGQRRAFGREAGEISMLEACTVAARHAQLAPSGFNIW